MEALGAHPATPQGHTSTTVQPLWQVLCETLLDGEYVVAQNCSAQHSSVSTLQQLSTVNSNTENFMLGNLRMINFRVEKFS